MSSKMLLNNGRWIRFSQPVDGSYEYLNCEHIMDLALLSYQDMMRDASSCGAHVSYHEIYVKEEHQFFIRAITLGGNFILYRGSQEDCIGELQHYEGHTPVGWVNVNADLEFKEPRFINLNLVNSVKVVPVVYADNNFKGHEVQTHFVPRFAASERVVAFVKTFIGKGSKEQCHDYIKDIIGFRRGS